MGRDVLFERIAPATYALQSLRVRYKELNVEREGGEDETMADDELQTPASISGDGKNQKDSPTEENGTRNDDDNGNEINIEEEESEEEDVAAEEVCWII